MADDELMPYDPQTLDDFIEWFATIVVGSRMAAWANTNDSHAHDERLYAQAVEIVARLVTQDSPLPELPKPSTDGTSGLANLRLWALRGLQLRDRAAVVPAPRAPNSSTATTEVVPKPMGWTAGELYEAAKISADKFGRIRDAAGIKKAAVGGGGAQRRFTKLDLVGLIDAVVTSTKPRFRDSRTIAASWTALMNPQ